MNADPNQAKAIFLEAVEKHDPDGWPAFLDQACAGQPDLRRRVEVLLGAHREAGTAQHHPVAECSAPVPIDVTDATERPGTVIGPYKLLQQIGEGGMGTVFMAEQTHPVHRKVALKVIKPGMDSRQVIARFEAERQALAMMDHVNIARVLDAGTIDRRPLAPREEAPLAEREVYGGRPYFVMELVHGVPITKYCDDNRLTPRERLELFVPVCQAIQHAHQKGIIHRDIKPSNVMVTLYDGKPVPKVIDFGVAKATEQKLTERTLFTQYGTMVGTLEYMSPEQAEMSALGVDTRSDIYSLGVLLYELLTGSTPLDRKRVREAAYAEILRMIKEEEPPKPSTRLSDSGEALASISAQRHMEPAKLTKLVRGELDWIVMKCLEKDRNRRYETANGLARDLQRHLADEQVQACPPSAGYKLRKFARKHKKVFLLATGFATLLVLSVVVSTWQAVRATRAESEARASERQALAAAAAEKKAKEAETAKRKQAEVVADLVESVFRGLDPKEPGQDLNGQLADRLDAAAAHLEKQYADEPLVLARLRDALASLYIDLAFARAQMGQWDKAASESGKAIDLGADAADLETSGWQLPWLRMHLGDAAEYRRTCLRLLERYEGTTNPDHANQAARLCVLHPDKVTDPTRAVQLARRAAEMRPNNTHYWDTLALAHYRAGDWKAAVAAFEKAMPLRAGSGSAQEWRFVLAMAHGQLGDKEQARKWYDQGIQWLKESEGRLNHQYYKELHSYRDEAAALLGIKDRKIPQAKPD